MEDEMLNIEQVRMRLGKRCDDDVGALLGSESGDDQAEMVLEFLGKVHATAKAGAPEDREDAKEAEAILKEEVEHLAGLLGVPVGRLMKMVREAHAEGRAAQAPAGDTRPVRGTRLRRARAKKAEAAPVEVPS